MESKISVGEALRETLAIFRDRAGVLVPVTFWLFLFMAAVERLTLNEIALFWISPVVSMVTITLYQGMVVGVVRDVEEGRRDSSVGDLVRLAWPAVLPLIGAAFIIILGVAGGLVLLVIPGIYLLTIWAVTAPVLVLERPGVFDALGRSRQLVRGNGWRVLGAVAVAFLLSGLLGLLLFWITESISDEPILRVVLSALGSCVTAPIQSLIVSVLYFRLVEISASSAPAAVEDPPVAA